MWLDSASACRPGDLQAYHPSPYRPPAFPPPDVCRANAHGDPITLFYDSCLGPQATQSACDLFKSDAANAACAACLVTPDTASQYGALISHGLFISTNVAGCIELTDPAGLGCAKSIQALSDCELAACGANCPVQDDVSLAAFDVCANDAAQVACAPYATAATCLPVTVDAGSPVEPCLAPSFAAFYSAAASLFCTAPAPAPASDADAHAADARTNDRSVAGDSARD